MILIRGHFSKSDRTLIRYATKFTLDYLLDDLYKKNCSIIINFSMPSEEDKDNAGTCHYDGTGKRKRCYIWVNKEFFKPEVKNQLKRTQLILEYLFHELVHVKQYLSGELVEIDDTRYCYKGEIFEEPKPGDSDGYYESPEEIEAFGRQQHLIERFKEHWKDHERHD